VARSRDDEARPEAAPISRCQRRSGVRVTRKGRNRPGSDVAQHRVEAERSLIEAQRNPVLSGAQSCAVAQAHALLAVEQRLAQLCTILESTLAEIVRATPPKSSDLTTSPSLVA
jgi:hypothetical protein